MDEAGEGSKGRMHGEGSELRRVGHRGHTQRLGPILRSGSPIRGPRSSRFLLAGGPSLARGQVRRSDAWYLSLDLEHRHRLLARGAIVAPPSVDPQVDSLLRRWRRQPPFDDERWFVERLTRDGFDIQEFPRLLTCGGHAAEDLPEKLSWQRLEQIYTGPRSGVAVTDPLGSVEPLLREEALAGAADLERRLSPEPEPKPHPSALAEILIAGCRRPLADLLERVTDGWLAPGVGLSPEAVFGLFRQLPVLARQLQERARLWIRHGVEVLLRLEEDWPLLVDSLLDGREPGAVVELDPSLGPRRRGGRAETRVIFDDGRSVIYRPHDLSGDLRLAALLRWLRRRAAEEGEGQARAELFDLRLPRLIALDGHGWMEPIEGQGLGALLMGRCAGSAGGRLGRALGRRIGAWSATWEVLGGAELVRRPSDAEAASAAPGRESDFVVAGAHVVPMDAGRFLAPAWRRAAESGGAAGRARPGTAQLPESLRPSCDAVREDCLRLFRRWRDDLLDVDGPLEAFRHVEVRVRPRPLVVYRALLSRSFRPSLLRDAAEREMCLDLLWGAVPSRPHLARVVAAEKDHLRRGDLPELVGRPGSCHLWDGDEAILHEVFDTSALDDLASRLERL
ncbi:MAG: DUF4135 domain-containing protein [Holophagales bacterium]|nr:DUF4135 domain-containing protein [Holophagales bacterium]